MLSSIPVNEMAETLRVLAGENAANAARHFTRRSYDMGDASSAILWSSIAQVLHGMAFAVPDASAAPAEQTSAGRIPESAAMQGVRYDDVDAEILAQEERPPIAIGPIPQRARAPKRYGFLRAPEAAGSRADRVPAPAMALAQAA